MRASPLEPVTMRRPEILILVVVLALFVFYYFGRADTIGVSSDARGWTPMTAPPLTSPLHYVLSVVLLGAVPLLVALRLSGARLSQLGLGLGNWRLGLTLAVVGAPFAVLAGWIAARNPAMQAVYPLDPTMARDNFAAYAALQVLYIVAWEVLFRGVLLFGLRGLWGEWSANAVQSGLAMTAHFGRAATEAFSALPASAVWGWFTVRLGSIWYTAAIHWTVGVSMDWFILH